MTKQQSAARDEAIASLRETLKPGDTVFTVLRSMSRSGMNRKIDLYKLEDGNPRWLSPLAACACGFTFDAKREAISVGGCGMDMGFHLVYSLSRVLFQDHYMCDGTNACLSNDHNNAWSCESHGECPVCRAKVKKNSPHKRAYGTGEYKVCSEKCATGEWQHSDGGYALRHRWM